MNIIEAFKTGKKVECHGEQWDTKEDNSLIERITAFEILSNDWEIVEKDDEYRNITRRQVHEACLKVGLSQQMAKAVTDKLLPVREGNVSGPAG